MKNQKEVLLYVIEKLTEKYTLPPKYFKLLHSSSTLNKFAITKETF